MNQTQPPTHTVDQQQRADFASIGAAIRAARPGDRILIRPGLYEEALTLDKPLELIGQGSAEEIIIEASGQHTLCFQASEGRVANLTLRQMGEGVWYGVDIAGGRLLLENCAITSYSASCIAIHDGATPLLRGNEIHDAHANGIFLYGGAGGTIEHNRIYGHDLLGITISRGSAPTVRANRIYGNKQDGISVFDGGGGLLEGNAVHNNGFAGIAIETGSRATVRANRIYENALHGIYIFYNGQAELEENEVFRNACAGVLIETGGRATLRANRVYENAWQAIQIIERGGGTFEDNDLRHNMQGAWEIAADSTPLVSRARNLE
jgi:F-box protein 11